MKQIPFVFAQTVVQLSPPFQIGQNVFKRGLVLPNAEQPNALHDRGISAKLGQVPPSPMAEAPIEHEDVPLVQ